MRWAFAVLMALHGFAHLVGFAGAWRLAPEKVPYKTTVLAGRFDLGSAGIRVLGVLWLLAAVAFAASALGAVMDRHWWIPATYAVAAASLGLSLLAWPEARIGVYVNIAIILVLLVGQRTGIFS